MPLGTEKIFASAERVRTRGGLIYIFVMRFFQVIFLMLLPSCLFRILFYFIFTNIVLCVAHDIHFCCSGRVLRVSESIAEFGHLNYSWPDAEKTFDAPHAPKLQHSTHTHTAYLVYCGVQMMGKKKPKLNRLFSLLKALLTY